MTVDPHDDAIEHALSEALDRLPQYAAPRALKRRLAARWPEGHGRPARRWRPWALALVPALAAALVLAVIVVRHRDQTASTQREAAVVASVVESHLRVASRPRPDVASSDQHVVRPWFTGRLDFAPVLPFPGSDDLVLEGGMIERIQDRAAAAFVYRRRLHLVTLLIVRADGLAWPGGPSAAVDRGFSVVVWRAGDLGYALVSDISPAELRDLAVRFHAPSG